MQQEIQVAVTWWAEQLRGTSHHTGSRDFYPALVAWAESHTTKWQPTEEQIQEFKCLLTKLLEQALSESGWEQAKRTQSDWGSAHRTLSVDYDASGILRCAAECVGIHYTCLLFPQKTIMWINPGEVKVQHGYGTEIQVLYSEK